VGASLHARLELRRAVVDPRTGEIIKGQVTLGSLRARQDYMIAEALLAPYAEGKPIPQGDSGDGACAHAATGGARGGHTLGLQHNFAASSIGQGVSVMDYPHPWSRLDADGKPDLSHAYTVGIGAWDKAAIRYGYSQFAPGTDESAALDGLLRSMRQTACATLPMKMHGRWAARTPTRIFGTTARTRRGADAHSCAAQGGAGALRRRTRSRPGSRWRSWKTRWFRSTCCTATRPRLRPSGLAD
jgi:hypothetical protein